MLYALGVGSLLPSDIVPLPLPLSLQVLGREFNPQDRSIDTHVSNLRRKLGPYRQGVERIKSVRGAGYLYAGVRD